MPFIDDNASIGAVVTLTIKSAVDDNSRFRSSKCVGLWLGFAPSRRQPGDRDVIGGIIKAVTKLWAGHYVRLRQSCYIAAAYHGSGHGPRGWPNVGRARIQWLHL
ncbi:transposase [Sulfitobacter sp. F26204]|uniref:transposase n=1 Tax=Sulfitobacter sp. F26204 TaxID=2996014 RepID=UPI00225E1412|nr:transposase [Sulfitobacter sp. F26204]MCX7561713.1 transposase [Sulfitobacter sp. F26204]